MSKYGNLTGTKLEGFPDEVIDKMLERQVEQGNKRNIEVFKKKSDANKAEGGFDWDETEEWHHNKIIWKDAIKCKNFTPFFIFYFYPKKLLSYSKQSLNNTVIEVLTFGHGAKVIEWWKKQGINTSDHEGVFCKECGCGCRYYGVIKGKFGNYSLKEVNTHNAKIITLPEEMKSFPRWMWCWDYFEEKAVKRLVIYYNEQLLHKYITLSETEAKRYLDGKLNCAFISYLYAKEIEESENKMDAAIEEICKELDGIVNQLNSLKNSPNEQYK